MTQEQLDKAQAVSEEIKSIARLLSSLNDVLEGKTADNFLAWQEKIRLQYAWYSKPVDKELAEYLVPYFEAKLKKYKAELEQL
jgi:hypothetical protein